MNVASLVYKIVISYRLTALAGGVVQTDTIIEGGLFVDNTIRGERIIVRCSTWRDPDADVRHLVDKTTYHVG